MNIIILGAGAIGSVYGAKLSKHHDVTLVGGAAHVAAIERDGLQLQGLLSETLHLPARTRDHVSFAGEPDPPDQDTAVAKNQNAILTLFGRRWRPAPILPAARSAQPQADQ